MNPTDMVLVFLISKPLFLVLSLLALWRRSALRTREAQLALPAPEQARALLE